MTVNAARRLRRLASGRRAESAPSASLAIGEINQTVFDCPACARPLALGARRCPGCGIRLVVGVPLSKASVIASVGLAVGIAIGLGVGLVVGHGRVAPAVAVLPSAAPLASAATSGTPGRSGAPRPSSGASSGTGDGSISDIPPISRSALFQAIGVDNQLAAAGRTLKSALAASTFDASPAAQTLRSMSADSIFGQQLAGRIADWPRSAKLGGDLYSLYGAVHATAAEGLVASVRNGQAYRAAATAMLKVLTGLATVDGEARLVAGQVGLDVAPSAAP